MRRPHATAVGALLLAAALAVAACDAEDAPADDSDPPADDAAEVDDGADTRDDDRDDAAAVDLDDDLRPHPDVDVDAADEILRDVIDAECRLAADPDLDRVDDVADPSGTHHAALATDIAGLTADGLRVVGPCPTPSVDDVAGDGDDLVVDATIHRDAPTTLVDPADGRVVDQLADAGGHRVRYHLARHDDGWRILAVTDPDDR